MIKKYYYTVDEEGGDIPKIAKTPGLATLSNTAVGPINAPDLAVAKTPPPDRIPLPNYNDITSRGNYLKQWATKYGNLEGRGDTVLKVNEVPRGATDTAKNISVKYGKQYGIDPALLYSSAMEEGMSGLFKDKSGVDTKGRKPTDFGYQDYYGDKQYPINGGQSFGFNTFTDRFPDLVKKGYLDKSFASNFRGSANEGQFNKADFKSTDAAMQAKAAMLKYHYDDVDSYAAHRGIKLSPKARDFFALAEYNGGEGSGHLLMHQYNEKGLLEGDKFLEKRPDEGDKKKPDNLDIWGHVTRRTKMANALKEQALFE